MRDFAPVYDLPNVPAVYALYSGGKRTSYVAYVGIAGKLKSRIKQHLIGRDSSVATGTSAVNLNPDFVTNISWWEHPDFDKAVYRKAAEMVAFEVLNPALRSRGATDIAGMKLFKDKKFKNQFTTLFEGDPTGSIGFPSLSDAIERIYDLESKIHELEKIIQKLKE
jgi:hypothetical protein